MVLATRRRRRTSPEIESLVDPEVQRIINLIDPESFEKCGGRRSTGAFSYVRGWVGRFLQSVYPEYKAYKSSPPYAVEQTRLWDESGRPYRHDPNFEATMADIRKKAEAETKKAGTRRKRRRKRSVPITRRRRRRDTE